MVPQRTHAQGIILVDKPAGPSSFARRPTSALAHGRAHRPRRAPSIRSHPGLLLLLSGKATRIAASFVGLDKRYLTDVDLRPARPPETRRAIRTGIVAAGHSRWHASQARRAGLGVVRHRKAVRQKTFGHRNEIRLPRLDRREINFRHVPTGCSHGEALILPCDGEPCAHR